MDPIDEEAELRASLAALGPGALAELKRVFEAGTVFPSSNTWDRMCELYGWPS